MGGCRRPNSIRGSSSDQTHSGACRSEGFVLREDVPDGLGELAGDVDAGDLRTSLPTKATLVALVALPIAGVPCGMGRRFDERPAEVLRPVLGERSSDITVARLIDPRAEPGVAGQLLGTRETVDVSDPRSDGVGEDVPDPRDRREQRDGGVVGTEPPFIIVN